MTVAVVGAGPSGFYAVDALFKTDLAVNINMFERLAAPYGLVRSGVAPDHPKLKRAIKVYARLAEAERFNYIGNVTVGRDLSVDELRATHHAVILTCGAETDRRLGIPGEDLPGSYTATEFVGWYNGHPDYRDRQFDLSHETAVIIGQGNVAADVSRILAKTVAELQHTDIAAHALAALAQSNIRNIYVIGRRGPAQAKFTSKELKEFGDLAACDPVLDTEELKLNPASVAELDNTGNKRIYDLFCGFAERQAVKQKRCVFTFLKSPREIIGESQVQRLLIEKNTLSGAAFAQKARGSGETFTLDTGIVFRSIGYHGIPMLGVPFDASGGVFANDKGRIIRDGAAETGLYTAGWIKRGPTGIIGTNKPDSVETVNMLLEDLGKLGQGESRRGAAACYEILTARKVHYIGFDDWKKIDAAEIARGEPIGKPREKYTSTGEMLALLD
ncbi:MAG: NADP oxidoreductase [Aestuariivita sp.]|nr:NADP oxidoreductase [Aestuariivita sp.]